jgi:hypothetical protein
MNNVTKKSMGFMLLMSVTTLATAHSQDGSLGKTTTAAAATDVYTVNCFNDGAVPAKLYVRVKDRAPKLAPALNVQIVKSGLASVQSIDAIDGDAVYSPAISLTGGAGDYTLIVNKALSTVKGIDTY